VALAIGAACSPATPAGDADGGGVVDPSRPPPPACSGARAPAAFARFKVGDGAPSGAFPSIQIGPDGTPVIAFVSGAQGQEQIMASRLPPGEDGAPVVQLVTMSPAGPTATPPRVAAIPDGRIVSAYVTISDGFAHGRYSTWSGAPDAPAVDTQPIADLTGVGSPVVAVGPGGQPMMVYLYADQSMRLLWQAADRSWSRETVEIGMDPMQSTLIDMTFDVAGQPVLVGASLQSIDYASGFETLLPSRNGLTIWRRAASGWTQERLLTDHVRLQPRILRSPSGEVTIFYVPTGGALARAVLRGGEWQLEDPIADAAGQTIKGDGMDVAFGPHGEIEAFVNGSQGMVQAVYDGCTWSQTAVAGSDAPSIAVDGAGRAHLAYLLASAEVLLDDAPGAEVWYARPQ
jgi:hypothetical protein